MEDEHLDFVTSCVLKEDVLKKKYPFKSSITG